MKFCLVKIFIIISINLNPSFCISQEMEESGIDTIKQIRWDTEVSYTDQDGNPYYYQRFEYLTRLPNRVMVIVKGNSKPSQINYFHVPDNCECISGSIQAVDSSNNSVHSVFSKTGDAIHLDSVFIPNPDYPKCLEQYFLNNNETLVTDTIRVSKIKFVPDDGETAFFLLDEGWWIKDKRHGYEISYYSTEELKGVLITANYRIKYIGQWEQGKKHGKWKYYNTSGELISIQKYKNGELIKEKSF